MSQPSLLDAVKGNDCLLVRSLLHLPSDDPQIVAPPSSFPRADPDTCDSDRSSALHWAAWIRTRPIFLSLLEAGANPSALNVRGESVLEWALRGGDMAILAALLTLPAHALPVDSASVAGGQAVHVAAEEGLITALGALVLRGANLNARDSRGKTPLMCACHKNKPVVVQWLLRHGASASLADNEGATALHYGAIGGSEFILQDILKQGAMASALHVRAFNDKETPEEIAGKYEHPQCVALLKRWKAQSSSVMKSDQETRNAVRLFMRTGLDLPAATRPFLTSTQIYFFIGIAFTLFHFAFYIQPILSSSELTNLSDDPLYNIMLTSMWTMSLVAIIGMYGFMFMDPGLVKKGPQLQREYQLQQQQQGVIPEPAPTSLVAASFAAAAIPYSTEWLIAQSLAGSASICIPCRTVKTIRSKHCALCGGCVLRLDHHCPWVNGCVGVNNHRSFFVIIISMLIASALHAYFAFYFVFSYTINKARNESTTEDGDTSSQWAALSQSKLILLLMCHSLLIFLSCGALLCGQTYTMMKGVTTNEMFNRWRYTYMANNHGSSPFSQGCFGNCLAFWGLKPGRSFIRPGQESATIRREGFVAPISSDHLNSASNPSSNNNNNNNNDVILELESLRSNGGGGEEGAHGHSHGGQVCHGHGGGHNTNSSGSAASDHSHSNGHSHPSSIITTATSSNAQPEIDAGDCAYFGTQGNSPNVDNQRSAQQQLPSMQQTQQMNNIDAESQESSGLLTGRAKRN